MIRKSAVAIAATIAVVLGCLIVKSSADAAVNTATVVPSPNPGSSSAYFTSVSCVSATFCVAVGTSYDGYHNKKFLVVWDGNAWTQVSTPDQGAYHDTLESISCATASSCMAVGSDGTNQSLMLLWDGSTWSLSPGPSSANRLDGVSCTDPTSCVAVGRYEDVNGGAQTVVVVWDGNVWTQITSPNPGAVYNSLTSVSCVTATTCTAVGAIGDYSYGDQARTLVLTLSDSQSPEPTTSSSTTLADSPTTSIAAGAIEPRFTG